MVAVVAAEIAAAIAVAAACRVARRGLAVRQASLFHPPRPRRRAGGRAGGRVGNAQVSPHVHLC